MKKEFIFSFKIMTKLVNNMKKEYENSGKLFINIKGNVGRIILECVK